MASVLIHSADQIRQTLITNNGGAPVVIGDVAEVSIGNLPRLGVAGYDDADDIVQGIVLMRRGAESVPTIKRVEAEVDKVNASGILPPGRQHPTHIRSQRLDPYNHSHSAAQHGRGGSRSFLFCSGRFSATCAAPSSSP